MALAPFAFAQAAFSSRQRFPKSFCEAPSSRQAWQARMNFVAGRGLEFIPDRLITAKWRPRFETTGLVHLEQARQRNRSVVLVFFHFGACALIPFWLRALGFPVIALLEGESRLRSRAKRLKDKLSPFSPLPTVLYRKDQLKTVIQLLRTGHVLFMAADRQIGKQITLPINEQCSFQMATGAIRLAATCDAELIPCCMIDEGRWRFRLEIGPPAPSQFLTPKLDTIGAAQHLLRQLLPVVRQRPELCAKGLLDCVLPNVPVSPAKTFTA